jgi:quercetin dioxygenase-like cupin family protein
MDTTTRDRDLAAGYKPAYAAAEGQRFNEGRRDYLLYKDLLVEAATNGRMRAEIMTGKPGGVPVPTGWHYHPCELQFLYVLKGWADMEIDGLGEIRVHEGESFFIPGYTIHRELRAGPGTEALEISVPAFLDVVNCDPPAGHPEAAK